MEARIRIIDNKKVWLIDDEYKYYASICREYDRPNFKGESLFSDHFESNDEGIIMFVKPPTKKYSSLEVYCFLVSLMVNQHLRICHNQVDSLVREAKQEYVKLIERVNLLVENGEKKG